MLKIILYTIYALLIIYVILLILELIFKKRNCTFDTYFGVPGSGKTTVAAWLAKKSIKKGMPVYSNVDIKGCFKCSKNDLGKVDFRYTWNDKLQRFEFNEHTLYISDEAGVEFNNRNYSKNFTEEQIDYLKHHRHYGTDMVFLSQYWNDIDVTLRRLSTRLFLLKKSLIPFFIKRKKIGKRISIDPTTKQIIDEYYFIPFIFGTRYIFAPAVWKMFNTHDTKPLINKRFTKYE